MKISKSDIVLKGLGVLLLVAAALKGYQLVTRPVASQDLWSYRPFLILQVETECLLGIWLCSSVYRRGAWYVTTGCFVLFSAMTLYRALSGATSCGCFGPIRFDPWLALALIDLPAVTALLAIRPSNPLREARARMIGFSRSARRLGRRSADAPEATLGSLSANMRRETNRPWASHPALRWTLVVAALVLVATTALLALVEPARVTASYEQLEPAEWVGRTLPILEHIDIADRLRSGRWLMLLYHHDCPDCRAILPRYRRLAESLGQGSTALGIALVEIAPYAGDQARGEQACTSGRLTDRKRWLTKTPLALALVDSRVVKVFPDGKIHEADLLFDGTGLEGGQNG